jgi:type II secretory pathway pseudopilin PulG
MDIAALVVSIVSAVGAVGAVWYSRRSDRSAAKSAAAAATTAALDMQRRNAELTPRFRVTCEPSNPGSPTLRLGVFLSAPPELERLDALTVTIRDDHPWRGQGTPLAGGRTPEQVAAQIWGPYRFIPGTGPGADSVRGSATAQAIPAATAAFVARRIWVRLTSTGRNALDLRDGRTVCQRRLTSC